MKNAAFGTLALVLIGFNLAAGLLHILKVFPYFFTLFYPLFCLLAMLTSIMGYFERDKRKTLSLLTGILALALLGHWIAALILRTSAM